MQDSKEWFSLIYNEMKELNASVTQLKIDSAKTQTQVEDLYETGMELKKQSAKFTELQIIQTKDIEEIKVDLREHKEGVIQNRKRIEFLEKMDRDQHALFADALQKHKEEMKPVTEHVQKMQQLPGKARDFIISASKVTAAVLTILTTLAGIWMFFKK